MSVSTTRNRLLAGEFDSSLKALYGEASYNAQKIRYEKVLDVFESRYLTSEAVRFFSAPGRTEVCGNHTDHNRGKVMAAAVNLDVIAAAAKTDDGIVRVKSIEYPKEDVIDISYLRPVHSEMGHSQGLIRGIIRGFVDRGYTVGGFNAVTVTQVLSGSGISSSAAFEVLIGTCLNYLYNDGKISPVEIAKIAQFAENEFFGKPSGLMDQMASSVGGFVKIDFKDTENPVITPIDFDFSSCGHQLCIVDTKASHADLTDEYGAIRTEMESCAKCFGHSALGDTDPSEVYSDISRVRKNANDRAVLRAIHFFGENERVEKEAAALLSGDFEEFKRLVIESGQSSFMYNQNVYSSRNALSQPVSVALAISELVLKGRGAWRVHGGGFAGTIQAFVPNDLLETYKSEIEKVYGRGACYVLSIRSAGGTEIL